MREHEWGEPTQLTYGTYRYCKNCGHSGEDRDGTTVTTIACFPPENLQRYAAALATIAKCPTDQLDASTYAWYVLDNRSEDEIRSCFIWPSKL